MYVMDVNMHFVKYVAIEVMASADMQGYNDETLQRLRLLVM